MKHILSDGVKEVDPASNKIKVVGAKVRDNLKGDSWEIRAKAVVNATGAFVGTQQ
jgi:glycerol-3-phosphate dehydrogenase